MPPMIDKASGCCNSAPKPPENTTGNTPKTVVKKVISCDLSRFLPAILMVSVKESCTSERFIVSIFRIESLSRMPIKTTMPMTDMMLRLSPASHNKPTAPESPNKMVSITISGCVSDSNWAAKIKNNKANATKNTTPNSLTMAWFLK